MGFRIAELPNHAQRGANLKRMISDIRNPKSEILMLFSLVALTASTLLAQPPDTLTIATGADFSGRQRMTGRVVDYLGDTLTWENAAGSQTPIAADRVVRIDSRWSDDQRAADQLFDSGQYGAALSMYAKAIAAEPRLWVRRMILAKAVWCCRNTGDPLRGVRSFLALLGSDPHTPYMDCIPLAWTSSPADPAVMATAREALALSQPAAAQLLGASWLLNGPDSLKATETLQRLATHDDRRIALLAETQLWRRTAGGALANQADRFGSLIGNMPLALQAGPALLWGDALSAANRPSEAALAYLRVPVLHPLAGDLAPEAWYRAAKSLEAEGRKEEAARALESLLEENPQSILAPAAKQRLELLRRP